MRSANNSVDTVNAAAAAIVSAEARVQPTTVPKRRWASCWSLYWCFGSQKNSKRIGHAVLVPEPVPSGARPASTENITPSTAIILPFIAPPSSPASFLQSDPPSATQTPAGLLSLTALSVNTYSRGGPPSIFTIGPYAYETQLVSPPVFSAFTTQPSTAPFTPPPESVQLTTPPSPEVPFAQLLSSSLERSRKNSVSSQKFALSPYDFQLYQAYPGSPGGNLVSPGSAISNSGTSSPFPDKYPIVEFRMGEFSKVLGFEHFTTRKWGSRLGSGTLTPNGTGLISRLGSGTLTPDGLGLGSRLGSGSLTPNGVGLDSRLVSVSLTPERLEPASGDHLVVENKISEVGTLVISKNGHKNDESIIHHRVSFELTGEDVARCLASKASTSIRTIPESPQDMVDEGQNDDRGISSDIEACQSSNIETLDKIPEKASAGDGNCFKKQGSITLRSVKEFNFEYTNGDVPGNPIGSKWWANEKVVATESRTDNNWTFFPMLQPGVS